MTNHNADWETCADDDCSGVCLPAGGKCLAHATGTDLDTE